LIIYGNLENGEEEKHFRSLLMLNHTAVIDREEAAAGDLWWQVDEAEE
jgi:hypothetical protein